ncbi:NUDIX hydrolase [Myxococcota bacterium]|nr:NUDIX hydrolase [Myxococcota bacterium]MBU1432450.1 NUDIX hydrolase [Myxococcota bacterium]MBU1896637.1 NUDIX hydrolase [Myxococcota bacterium]
MKPTLKHSQTLYASKRGSLSLETFATPDGDLTRAFIHHPGAVGIIARPDPDHLVLVRQFRYALRAWTIEIPAGTREPEEPAAVTAGRELAEEAGFHAEALREVLTLHPGPGGTDEAITLFYAEGLSPTPTRPDQGELVSPMVASNAEIKALLSAGEITDAKTLIALSWLGFRLNGDDER